MFFQSKPENLSIKIFFFSVNRKASGFFVLTERLLFVKENRFPIKLY